MNRRSLLPSLCVALVGALVTTAPAASGAQADSWNRTDQRRVVESGLMAKAADGRFHGERPLTAGAMQRALATIAMRRGLAAVAVPASRMTIERFHSLVVRQLGLSDVAAHFRSAARRAGLRPPGRFGTEVVVRLLSLRYNHPARDDRLELFPWDAISRAEAAYTLARVDRLHGGDEAHLRETAASFRLPRYSSRQRAGLRVAVAKIGMPYVWGGETDGRSARYGSQAHGGYDCSGFVWRVFKLSGDPAGRRIGGRTAAQMSGEIPRASRVAAEALRPADLVFFGPAGFGSRATERSITHVGIALSADFMIHSSSQGVYVSPLAERMRSFSWGRRVL